LHECLPSESTGAILPANPATFSQTSPGVMIYLKIKSNKQWLNIQGTYS
jgi:hypothetical protein